MGEGPGQGRHLPGNWLGSPEPGQWYIRYAIQEVSDFSVFFNFSEFSQVSHNFHVRKEKVIKNTHKSKNSQNIKKRKTGFKAIRQTLRVTKNIESKSLYGSFIVVRKYKANFLVGFFAVVA